MVFKPSGAVSVAIKELHTKSNKAWFAISNTVYQNKKMSVTKALNLVDSLVTPVGLYACEFWTPYCIPAKSFNDKEALLKFWEGFLPETLNQRICRLLLSVHKKSSRLAVLGEMARLPLFLKALVQALKYEWCLVNKSTSPLVQGTLQEMRVFEDLGNSNWLSRIKKIKKLLSIPDLPSHLSPNSVGAQITKLVQSHFESFYLQQINKVSIGDDGIDHNKLRFYKGFKGSFTKEPYLNLVNNRNQRAWLTRMRISSHHLRIETGRWGKPKPTPIEDRLCKYCPDSKVDNESHFLLGCATLMNKTRCFENKLSTLVPGFNHLSDEDKLSIVLCPTLAQATKLTNKYIDILFKARTHIDNGEHISNLTFPPNLQYFTEDDLNVSSSLDCTDSDLECSFQSDLSSLSDFDS